MLILFGEIHPIRSQSIHGNEKWMVCVLQMCYQCGFESNDYPRIVSQPETQTGKVVASRRSWKREEDEAFENTSFVLR